MFEQLEALRDYGENEENKIELEAFDIKFLGRLDQIISSVPEPEAKLTSISSGQKTEKNVIVEVPKLTSKFEGHKVMD